MAKKLLTSDDKLHPVSVSRLYSTADRANIAVEYRRETLTGCNLSSLVSNFLAKLLPSSIS